MPIIYIWITILGSLIAIIISFDVGRPHVGGAFLLFAAILGVWLAIAAMMPLRAQAYSIHPLQTLKSGLAITQVIVVDGKIIDLNHKFHGFAPVGTKIKMTEYEQTYLGIDFMGIGCEPKYEVTGEK